MPERERGLFEELVPERERVLFEELVPERERGLKNWSLKENVFFSLISSPTAVPTLSEAYCCHI